MPVASPFQRKSSGRYGSAGIYIKLVKETARKYGSFAINLLSATDQVHLAELEAEHQANMFAAQLVACFLQRLCVLYDFNPKGFDLPYSKSLIASRLGMNWKCTIGQIKRPRYLVDGNKVSDQ